MLLNLLILKTIEHIKDERSISAIYQLLSGRKSIQTKQDAQFFNMRYLYDTCPNLSYDGFNKRLTYLDENKLISSFIKDDTKYVYLLKDGEEKLKGFINTPVRYFKNTNHNLNKQLFLKRLYLFTQTIANVGNGNYSFIPVIDCYTTKLYVKEFYRYFKGKEKKYLLLYHQDLLKLLDHFTETEANIFIDRLTGKNNYGLSIEQLASKYNLSYFDIEIILLAMSKKMIHLIIHNKNEYFILPKLLHNMKRKKSLSKSAMQTYLLLQNDYNLQQIAKLRNLKINTIKDHIVEIALENESFPIRSFIKKEIENEILQVAKQLKTRRLKDIKHHLENKEIDYFHIRLALTKL